MRREQTGVKATGLDDTSNDLARRIRLNPPQDFGQVTRLVELITEKPVILTPLRCSHCGADLRLPSSGQYVQCTHCGYVYHVTNVTQMIEELLRR
jgi:ribosomal protein S27AE